MKIFFSYSDSYYKSYYMGGSSSNLLWKLWSLQLYRFYMIFIWWQSQYIFIQSSIILRNVNKLCCIWNLGLEIKLSSFVLHICLYGVDINNNTNVYTNNKLMTDILYSNINRVQIENTNHVAFRLIVYLNAKSFFSAMNLGSYHKSPVNRYMHPTIGQCKSLF